MTSSTFCSYHALGSGEPYRLVLEVVGSMDLETPVTVRVFVMLGIYFVNVKYMFVCIKLICVYVKFLKI
jgi:hypothetical protein